MGSKPLIKIAGNAEIALILDRDALEEVDEFHEPSPFAKASGDSLRESLRLAGLPAEALAKAGGGQAFLPSLTDALRFDIQGVASVA